MTPPPPFDAPFDSKRLDKDKQPKKFRKSEYQAGTGKILVDSLSKNKKIPFRELVANAFDAIRKRRALIKKQIVDNIPVENRKPWAINPNDIDLPESERWVKIYYPDIHLIDTEFVDIIIEDNGIGIRAGKKNELYTFYDDFTSFGHLRKDTDDEEGVEGLEPPTGYFGIGKATALKLSSTKTVEFHSVSLTETGRRYGMIATMRLVNDELGFDEPPEYVDSTEVMNHLGMKIIIKNVRKEILQQALTKKALKEFLQDTMVLKISRGYKLYIVDVETGEEEQIKKPEGYDTKDVELYTLANGSKVMGNINEADVMAQQRKRGGTYTGNLDLFKDSVKIQTIDIAWNIQGRLNCDEFRILATRDGLQDDDEVFEEVMTELAKYLENMKYTRRTAKNKNNPNANSYYQKEAGRLINKFYAQNPDMTIVFPPGIKMVEGQKGLTNEKDRGKLTYNILKNKKLITVDNIEDANLDIISRKNQKRGKKSKPRKTKKGPKIPKWREIIDAPKGKGVDVKVRNNPEVEQEDLIHPDIPLKPLPNGSLENPTLYYDPDELAFMINLIRPSAIIFQDMKSKAANHEIARAIIRATPDANKLSSVEFDKMYYKLIDSAEKEDE